MKHYTTKPPTCLCLRTHNPQTNQGKGGDTGNQNSTIKNPRYLDISNRQVYLKQAMKPWTIRQLTIYGN